MLDEDAEGVVAPPEPKLSDDKAAGDSQFWVINQLAAVRAERLAAEARLAELQADESRLETVWAQTCSALNVEDLVQRILVLEQENAALRQAGTKPGATSHNVTEPVQEVTFFSADDPKNVERFRTFTKAYLKAHDMATKGTVVDEKGMRRGWTLRGYKLGSHDGSLGLKRNPDLRFKFAMACMTYQLDRLPEDRKREKLTEIGLKKQLDLIKDPNVFIAGDIPSEEETAEVLADNGRD